MTTTEMIKGLQDGTLGEEVLRQEDWEHISRSPGLPEDFIRRYKDKVDWLMVLQYQKLSEALLRERAVEDGGQGYWDAVLIWQDLTESFIHDFARKLDWVAVSIYQHLTEDFIAAHKQFVDWEQVSRYQLLSESMIGKFKDKVDWEWISSQQKLSESFIQEHSRYVDWENISRYQRLSERFIREHAGDVDWYWISRNQRLSESLINEHAGKVDWMGISACQKLSAGFIRKYEEKLDMNAIRDNWAYKTPEELEYAVRDTSLYECHKGYFIAYKGIRKDRYSDYNFQYQYLPGETYETFADCSDKADSCGFSVWTRGSAEEYCRELVIPCRIEYKDVARVIVGNGGKVRCRKLTILG